VNRLEVVGTRAHGFPFDDVAYRVHPAGFFARVYASTRLADAQQRAIDVAVRAQAFFPAPVRIRVPDVARRASADVSRRWVRFAHGGRMARRLVARLRGFARYLRDGVGFETGGTLAQQLMSVGQAHRVRPARVSVAQVHAGMRLSVACLRLRTIVVVHARNFSAAVGVVRVARERARRTLALSHVVVRHADRVRAAHRMITDGSARFRSARRIFQTRFGGQALGVSQTTALQNRTATVSIVRVPFVSGHALAVAFVIAGRAHRIYRARQLDTHRCAFQHAQRVRSARLAVFAVGVHRAIGQRGFLALRYDWIPRELATARTDGCAVTFQQTNLVRPARHAVARAYARGYPVWHDGTHFTRRVTVFVRSASSLRRHPLEFAP